MPCRTCELADALLLHSKIRPQTKHGKQGMSRLYGIFESFGRGPAAVQILAAH